MTKQPELKPFYRVERSEDDHRCEKCGSGSFWDIVYVSGGEECSTGITYEDKEHAEDICYLMNDAFEMGAKAALGGE